MECYMKSKQQLMLLRYVEMVNLVLYHVKSELVCTTQMFMNKFHGTYGKYDLV